MVEDFGLARLCLGDQGLVKHIEHVLADLLEFGLDLLTVLADCANVLVGAFGFLLLLDRGNNSPGSTSGSHDVLVGDRQQIPFVDGEFTSNL